MKIAVILMMLSTTGLAVYATHSKIGAQNPEHPQGISLRDESRRSNEGFFLFYGRSHFGGGMHDGK